MGNMHRQARPNTMTGVILDFIQKNPGCTRLQILSVLPADTKPSTVSNLLGRLQRSKAIENRGGFAKWAAWYMVENETPALYRKKAAEFLEELHDIHPAQRQSHLARRLEEFVEEMLS